MVWKFCSPLTPEYSHFTTRATPPWAAERMIDHLKGIVSVPPPRMIATSHLTSQMMKLVKRKGRPEKEAD